jgi:hypothetical protein
MQMTHRVAAGREEPCCYRLAARKAVVECGLPANIAGIRRRKRASHALQHSTGAPTPKEEKEGITLDFHFILNNIAKSAINAGPKLGARGFLKLVKERCTILERAALTTRNLASGFKILHHNFSIQVLLLKLEASSTYSTVLCNIMALCDTCIATAKQLSRVIAS